MNEDMILPDDFEATPQAETSEPIEQQPTETVEDTTKAESVPEQTEQPKIKVKFNHEEKEITLDEAREYAQKGLNYDKVQEKLKALETDPRLSFVEMQAKKYNMSPTEYIEAVRQQEEQAQLQELLSQNIPEQYAKEMLENKKFREQYEAEKQQKAQEEKQKAEYNEFLENYPDVKAEDIPKEVWDDVAKGKSLSDAYARHEVKALKDKIKILEQNEKNKSKAPIKGISQHGSSEVAEEDDFLRGFNSI